MNWLKQKPQILKTILAIIIFLFALCFIGIIVLPSLRNYSENQERKDMIKLVCGLSNLCLYSDSEKIWGYNVMPKTEEEAKTIITPERKFFTKEKECEGFCYKDFTALDKKTLDDIFSKEKREEIQETYPELRKSFWYKLNNWLDKI